MDKKLITIHLINLDDVHYKGTLCRHAVVGDKAITTAQAEDSTNGLTFNCRECYKVWRGEYPGE